MPTSIDETELARLEALAGKALTLPFEDMAADGWGYVVVDILPAVTTAVPALVAEVRRLREELNVYIEEDQSRVLLVQRQMLDFLRAKVEAWEWWEEVRTYDTDAFHPYREHKYANPYEDKKAKAYENAYLEWAEMWHAAREAVHADRE